MIHPFLATSIQYINIYRQDETLIAYWIYLHIARGGIILVAQFKCNSKLWAAMVLMAYLEFF